MFNIMNYYLTTTMQAMKEAKMVSAVSPRKYGEFLETRGKRGRRNRKGKKR